MRWLVSGVAVLMLAAVTWGWLTFGAPEASIPIVETEPVSAVPEREAPAVAAVEPAPPDAGVEVATAVPDAGVRTHEVTVEVFGANGHEAGAAVSFHAEPIGRYQRWEALRNPEADFGAAVGGGRTNVMGFTTAQLPPGRWRVRPPAEPQYVTIREDTKEISVALRQPDIVRGIVIDENGKGVPNAVVQAERDRPEARAARGLGIPVNVDQEGRFALTTFDSVLTFSARSPSGRDEQVFKKRVNVPCPEVKLYLGRLGQVHFEVSGARGERIAVEIESFGIMATGVINSSQRLSVIPGHVKFRARAAGRKVRLAGSTEVDVKAGEVTEAKLELAEVKGQRIHLVDEDQRPVAAAQVLLRSLPYAASATTDSNGDAWFSPGAPDPAKLDVTNRCLRPMPLVTVLDDELTAIVVPCDAPDSGVAIEGD